MWTAKGLPEKGPFRHLSSHSFRVNNFGGTSARRLIFFFQNPQNLIKISQTQWKIQKKCLAFEIITFEFVA